MEVDYGSLQSVLAYLAGAGAPYVVGYILSLVVENWPAWHDLPRAVKFFAPLVLSTLLSVGATLLASNTALVEQIGPTYAMIASAVLMYLGTQNAYLAASRAHYGESAKREAKG
jgi:hypothetical protein